MSSTGWRAIQHTSTPLRVNTTRHDCMHSAVNAACMQRQSAHARLRRTRCSDTATCSIAYQH
jgi:hypothetical protein